jgi:hypothetical protein
VIEGEGLRKRERESKEPLGTSQPMTGRPTSGRHEARMIERVREDGVDRDKAGRETERERESQKNEREKEIEKVQKRHLEKRACPTRGGVEDFMAPTRCETVVSVSAGCHPHLLKKGPAQAHQPNVYLEPKWLRCR